MNKIIAFIFIILMYFSIMENKPVDVKSENTTTYTQIAENGKPHAREKNFGNGQINVDIFEKV